MAARTPLIAGNWKMHKTQREAEEYIQALLPLLSGVQGVQVAICPPFTDLHAIVESARGSLVEVFAQNMHQEREGAFTGEVSPAMLSEIGVHGVVLGHSERRELFAESDRALALKLPAALSAGLRPVLCVGETEQEREEQATERKLRTQLDHDLSGLQRDQLAEVVIAYEPIWALVADRDADAGREVKILYGGSVTPENAAELLALPDVDGALVGGASLQATSFAEIVAATR